MNFNTNDIVSLNQYCADVEKTHTSVSRYLKEGLAIPGIAHYIRVHDRAWLLIKDKNYRSTVAKIKTQKYLVVSK